jgi:type II secretion system protein G
MLYYGKASMRRNINKKGFTLIELLVVIAIIALLASIVLVALGGARSKARDATRRATVTEIGKALELYYADNGSYPNSGNTWAGVNECWGSTNNALSGANGYIPGLAPTYIATLPVDPLGDTSCGHQYIYNSNGTDYFFMAYGTVENCSNMANDSMHRPLAPTECDYAIYTPGASQY